MTNAPDITDRSVLTVDTVHWLLAYYLATSAGSGHLAAIKHATAESGKRPDRDILTKAASYYAARAAAKNRGPI